MRYSYDDLVRAISQSPSPNLAYRTVKEMLINHDELRIRISKECLDVAWADAARFNRMVERQEGRLARPARLKLDEAGIIQQASLIRSSSRPHFELGRVMSSYDIESVNSVYSLVEELFAEAQ